MGELERAAVEADPRFPSGAWAGFFLQYWLPGRHPTAAGLTWAGGRLDGTGQDRVGPYKVVGTYDPVTGRCAWTKQYVGKHAVAYRGVADASGVWGVWEIRLFGGLYSDRGGFHIWPEGAGRPADAERTEQAVLALMRKEFGSPARRAAFGLLALGAAAALGLWLWRGMWYWAV